VSDSMVFDVMIVKDRLPHVSEVCLHASLMFASKYCLSMPMLLVKQIYSDAPTTGGTAAASAVISGITVQTIAKCLMR
jgi:hypothetical protein